MAKIKKEILPTSLYSYNKSQQYALFVNFILLKNSASRWLSLQEYVTIHGPLDVKFPRLFIFRNICPSIYRLVGLSIGFRRNQIYVNLYRLWHMLVPLRQACIAQAHWFCDDMEIETFEVIF